MSIEKKSKYRNLSIIFPLFSPYKKQVFFAFIALLITTFMILFFGKMIKYIIDFGFHENSQNLLYIILLIFFLSVIIMAVAGYFRSSIINKVSEKAIANLRKKTYNHILNLSAEFFEITKAGDVISRLTVDSVVLYETLSSTISFFFRNLLLFIGGIFFLFITSFKLTLVSIVAIFIAILPIIFLGKRIKNLSKKSQENLSLVGSHIEESVNGVKIIQAYNCQKKEQQNFAILVDNALKASLKKIKLKSFLVALVIALAFSSVALILFVGSKLIMTSQITSGDLSSFIFYSIIIATSLVSLSQISGQLQNASAAASRIFEILEITSTIKEVDNFKKISTNKPLEIKFEDVCFSYPASKDQEILSDFNLTIKPKEKLSLVGVSGSGKSTILQLLLRFYDTTNGKILINETDIKEVSLKNLRELFSYISQDCFIFSGTIFENIAYSDSKITKKEIEKLISENKALEFINKLPNKLDTFVGQKGSKLSGGEKQRIAFARALVKNSPILLLDEATSALDNQNEQEITKAITQYAKDKTVIIIAHDFSTIAKSDRIIFLQDGKIIEEKSNKSLLSNSSYYQEKYNIRS
jgi:ATP-binding cassette subfamily B protein